MADQTISSLTALLGAGVDIANDVIPIVDISAGTTKKITLSEFAKSGAPVYLVSLYDEAGNLMISSTSPTIASGFGTTPTILANTTAAFKIIIGTGGTDSSGVLTMPAAPNGWAAYANNVTHNSTMVVGQTADSTTSVTLQNYSRTTGLSTPFTAGDEIHVLCMAY